MNLKHIILILSAVFLLLTGCGKEPLETTGGLRNNPGRESTGATTDMTFSIETFNPAAAASALMARNTVSHFLASLVRGNAAAAAGCVSENATSALLEILRIYDPAGTMIRASGVPLSEQMQTRVDAHTKTLLSSCFRDYSIESVEKLSPTQYTATASLSCIEGNAFGVACGNITYENLLLAHAYDAARVTAEQGEKAAYEYLMTLLIDHLEAQLASHLSSLPAQVHHTVISVERTDGKWLITDLQLFNG